MVFFFDYIYYRLTKFYFRWYGKSGGVAVTGISMIQTLVLADVLIFVSRLFFERSETIPYAKLLGSIGAVLFALLWALNFRKYRGKYNDYRNHWKNEESRQRIVKGIFVILSLLVPWIPLILIGVFW